MGIILHKFGKWCWWYDKAISFYNKVSNICIIFSNTKNLKPFRLTKNKANTNLFTRFQNNEINEIPIPKNGYNPFLNNNINNINQNYQNNNIIDLENENNNLSKDEIVENENNGI